MRTILVALFCIFTAGCAVPPLLTYVSLGLDGVSFFTTGKSVGDHALSAAFQQDCKVWRLVKEQAFNAVCRDGDYGAEILVAMRETDNDVTFDLAPADRLEIPFSLALFDLDFAAIVSSEP